MFQTAALERLQMQKDLLVLQSDAQRLQLAVEWQELRSPEHWLRGTANAVRRHPVWSAVLATAAGMLAVHAVRKSGAVTSGMGRLGKIASTAFSVWKFLHRKNSED